VVGDAPLQEGGEKGLCVLTEVGRDPLLLLLRATQLDGGGVVPRGLGRKAPTTRGQGRRRRVPRHVAYRAVVVVVVVADVIAPVIAAAYHRVKKVCTTVFLNTIAEAGRA